MKLKRRKWLIDEESPERLIFHSLRKVIVSKTTKFQEVEICDTELWGRMLITDGRIQSAQLDEHIYHEALVHPSMVVHPKPEKVLILGGGEGATLREVLKHPTVKKAIMVDIDRELVEICKKHLPSFHKNCFKDKRARLLFTDGIQYIEKTKEMFDVVICDLSDPIEGNQVCYLYTREFYRKIKKILHTDGIFITQSNEFYHGKPSIFSIIHRTVESTFVSATTYLEYIPSFGSLWTFTLAGKDIDKKVFEIEKIKRRFKERKIKTKFYTPLTHLRMFILPPEAVDRVKNEQTISRNKNPAYVF